MSEAKQPSPFEARLMVAPTKAAMGPILHKPIIDACLSSLASRGVFTIALSGGSLPSFLSTLANTFDSKGADPKFDKWHVLLADERCVPHADADSNFRSLKENFLDTVPIPSTQIYGIDEKILHDSAAAAKSYESLVVKPLLEKSGGKLDCVVLGFGPDGHTCSLFPEHPLLKENDLLVASIDDSPKPPPSRITLTFPVLNRMSRCVIFCGAGSSKDPILRAMFDNGKSIAGGSNSFDVMMKDPAPYPCGMVRSDTIIWIVDADAARGLAFVE